MANYNANLLPKITEERMDSEKERRQILNYLALLDEKLRYMFQNIDPEENFSGEAFQNYIKTEKGVTSLQVQQGKISALIADMNGNFTLVEADIEGLRSTVANQSGDISLIQQRADALAARVSNAEGDVSALEQTAEGILTRVSNAEGDISAVEQTASALTTRVAAAEKGVSEVKQTASSLTTRIANAEGDISTVEQTASSLKTRVSNVESDVDDCWAEIDHQADRISLVVYGSSTTRLTLTDDMIEMMAEEIRLNGEMKVYGGTTGTTYGGYLSYGSGNNGSSTTTGVMLSSKDQYSYFIATNTGVRMTYDEDYAVHCTSKGVTLVGDYDFRAATNFYCLTDGGASLGTSSYHWDVVFADTGTINTSDRRKKHGIDYAMSAYEELFRKLKPCTYKLNNGKSGRDHVGFIAQDIEESMEEIGMDSGSFAGFIKSPVYEKELENGEPDTESDVIDYNYSLRYSEFVALNTMMIQKMMWRIEELEAKVAYLESKLQ